MQLISDIVEIYRNYPATLRTEVLVASVRGPNHVIEAARLGAHVVTVPPKVLRDLALHPLTDKGLAAFLKDWEATGQRIAVGGRAMLRPALACLLLHRRSAQPRPRSRWRTCWASWRQPRSRRARSRC